MYISIYKRSRSERMNGNAKKKKKLYVRKRKSLETLNQMIKQTVVLKN